VGRDIIDVLYHGHGGEGSHTFGDVYTRSPFWWSLNYVDKRRMTDRILAASNFVEHSQTPPRTGSQNREMNSILADQTVSQTAAHTRLSTVLDSHHTGCLSQKHSS